MALLALDLQKAHRDVIHSHEYELVDEHGNPIGPDHPLRKEALKELHGQNHKKSDEVMRPLSPKDWRSPRVATPPLQGDPGGYLRISRRR